MLTACMYGLYRLAGWLFSPLVLLYLIYRSTRDRRYLDRIVERLGALPPAFRRYRRDAIWIHGVSVGEVMSAIRLVDKLGMACPGVPVYLSCGTVAGRELAEQKLAGKVAGTFYLPLDYVFAIRRVLRAIRPSLLVVLETEIWPHLYREVRRTGCALLVANGRISDRALPRYRRLAHFFARVLEHPNAILVQSGQDRERYLAIGAPESKVRVAGNLKFDFDPAALAPPEPVAELIHRLRPSSIWIAASTMPPARPGDPDEDDGVIAAFQALAPRYPGLLLILAPRRPERFDEAAARLERAAIPYLRRSRLEPADALELPGVLLLDSIGELAGLFPLADVVFMGGTLPHRGGHNVLEPAFFGRAIIAGPHMENFAAIAAEFAAAGAWQRITEGAELPAALDGLLRDPAARARLGEAARTIAGANRGVTDRIAAEAARLHDLACPLFPAPLPARLLLGPLAALWVAGGWLERRLTQRRARRLPVAVVSIGGLTVGGAGKTPFTDWLAGRFADLGLKPAILTRGYRRDRPGRVLAFEPGESAPASETGDEAAIFLAHGRAAVGIAADRYRAAQAVLARARPGVFLLDDGFQHARLARDCDLVLIDTLDPFAGGAPVPLGRLREPLSALRRASAFILTRCEPGRRYAGLIRKLHTIQPAAPVFRARVEPRAWVEPGSSGSVPIAQGPPQPAYAFCGLANPAAFWRSLEQLGLACAGRRVFRDHYRYRAPDLEGLAAEARGLGAASLVTTEKDAANLPPDLRAPLAGLPLYWLEIGIAVEEEDALLAFLSERIALPQPVTRPD